jgi:hypothetical protein
VIGRLYEKKRSGASALGLFCNINQYFLEGCREMGVNYKLQFKNFDVDDEAVCVIQSLIAVLFSSATWLELEYFVYILYGLLNGRCAELM